MSKPFQSIIFILLALLQGCSNIQESDVKKRLPVASVGFLSSDEELNIAWEWARETALSYVRQGDAVGPWYEAALPGREAFCMRDVSHQTTGASVLGLDKENKNMLFRFAENISESKDWCSYWEINKDNLPAPVDYKNDKDFWYNLPANFDVIDACFRMYLWTGDSSYVTNPVFLNFYKRTLSEYIDRWDLSPENILERDRLMNLPEDATPENHKYYSNRGIPGYHEGGRGRMRLGIDLLATQYAAYNWYHYMHGDQEDSHWRKQADKTDSIIQNIFWDPQLKKFNLLLYDDGSYAHSVGDGADFSHLLLHFNVLNDLQKINSILDTYSNDKEGFIIEIASHLPDIFFHNGRAKDGIYMLKYLTDSNTYRREYPENPFSVVGAFVTGLMGVTVGAPDHFISTFSGLEDPNTQAMLTDLPVMGKSIDLLHRGRHTSILHNHSAETIYWSPYLEGVMDEWYINGKKESGYGEETEYFGLKVSSFLIGVPPYSFVSVSAFPNPEPANNEL